MGVRLGAAGAGLVLALGAAALLDGCGSSGSKRSTAATLVPAASTTAPAPATTTAAPVTPLLLTSADLPPGFAPAPSSEPGDRNSSLSPCGHPLTPVSGATAQAEAAFDRNSTEERVIEQVVSLPAGQAAGLVDQVRQIAAGCHQFDQTINGSTVTLQVMPIQLPPGGDPSAGVQLANSARFTDVVVLETGQIDAIVFISEVGNAVPAATLQAVVSATGARLAHP